MCWISAATDGWSAKFKSVCADRFPVHLLAHLFEKCASKCAFLVHLFNHFIEKNDTGAAFPSVRLCRHVTAIQAFFRLGYLLRARPPTYPLSLRYTV